MTSSTMYKLHGCLIQSHRISFLLQVKVILQIFDLLYLNGQSLLREPLRARRLLMQRSFTHCEGMLHFASGLDHVEDGDTTPIER